MGSPGTDCVQKLREELSNPNTWQYAKKLIQAFENFETEASRRVPNISTRELLAPMVLSQQGLPTWRTGIVELIKS
ncbi:MAG: hypothetical protein K2X66_10780, partial [Cyanobacteria bacterium]|nr:hypothetical protein [Cyanobacteriota bacterium]